MKRTEVTTIRKGMNYRIIPDQKQQDYLEMHFRAVRYVWNWALSQQIERWRDDSIDDNPFKRLKGYGKGGLGVEWTAYKANNEEVAWIKECNADSLNKVLLDQNEAFSKFRKDFKKNNSKKEGKRYKPRKDGLPRGFPFFKSRFDDQSVWFRNIKLENNRLYLPKLKSLTGDKGIRVRLHTPVDGEITSLRIIRDNMGKYMVSFSLDTHDEIPEVWSVDPSKVVGIDLGIKDFAILSDGTVYENQKYLKRDLKEVSFLMGKMRTQKKSYKKGATQTKGSIKFKKKKKKVQKLHKQIANRRKDYLHKITTEIVNNYDAIVIEDLNVAGMMKNRRLALALSELGLHEFKRQLQYKCQWQGKPFIQVDRWFASSQLCSVCGYKNEETKNLSVREWRCPDCNTIHDRDVNAANNIRNEGLIKLDELGLLEAQSGDAEAGDRNILADDRRTTNIPDFLLADLPLFDGST